jgi:hypothetical protein
MRIWIMDWGLLRGNGGHEESWGMYRGNIWKESGEGLLKQVKMDDEMDE